MKRFKLQTVIEIAIFAAIAMLLDLIPSIKFGPSISISFAMVPIFIIAFRWGIIASVTSGFLWGILQIALGEAWILTPTQAFIEYFIAFACIGSAGLFMGIIQKNLKDDFKGKALIWIIIAVYIGSMTRYFWHFVAGVIFFKSYAIEAGKAPFIYSLTMNGITYFFASLACSIVLILLISRAPQLVTSATRQ
jgi:thiamine transporter